MGPMVGGDPWTGSAVLLALGALLVLIAGAAVLVAARVGGATPARRSATPENVLRARYARGELTRDQYRAALVDVLKDRYVRGELELEAYEAQLARLLDTPAGRDQSEAA